MSSYTKNLNLMKKDPVTDGSETFNIKTMMNDNWDKIDAALPGGDVKSAPVEGDTVLLYDSEDPQKGKPKKTLLSALISMVKPERIGAVKIQTGSYVGTGTYGAENKSSLTFSSVPKIVFIFIRYDESDGNHCLAILSEHTGDSYITYGERFVPLIIDEWGKTVKWHTNKTESYGTVVGDRYQLNISGRIYDYIAIV